MGTSHGPRGRHVWLGTHGHGHGRGSPRDNNDPPTSSVFCVRRRHALQPRLQTSCHATPCDARLEFALVHLAASEVNDQRRLFNYSETLSEVSVVYSLPSALFSKFSPRYACCNTSFTHVLVGIACCFRDHVMTLNPSLVLAVIYL